MNDPADRRVLLLLGLPGAGITAAALVLSKAGIASLPAPGRLASLERLAERLPAALGISAQDPGPLALAGRTVSATAALIDGDLEAGSQERAVGLLDSLLPAGRVTLLASETMMLLPRFWLGALAKAGVGVQVVLVDRSPLALATGEPTAVGRTIRRTVFAWHYLTLQLLAAAPEAVIVPVRALLEGHRIDPRLDPPDGGRWHAPGLAAHPRDEADLAVAPVASSQAGELASLLLEWNTLAPADRQGRTSDLAARLDEAVAVTGIARPPARRVAVTSLPRPAKATAAPRDVANVAVPQELAAGSAVPKRPLVVHYHIFKNAGTSVDRMLKANFGDAWVEQEFTSPLRQRQEDVRAFLAEHPELKGFSSHTAMLPEPVLPDRQIIPVLFVRHPLLRLRSAYDFERKQIADTRGAALAKANDFGGYVEALLDDPRLRQARNFQAFCFAAGTPGSAADELERASATLERLPFVGLVEAYEASIARLAAVVTPFMPEFKPMILHENATAAGDRTSTDRLAALQDELGPALYERLVGENLLDLELFERVRSRY